MTNKRKYPGIEELSKDSFRIRLKVRSKTSAGAKEIDRVLRGVTLREAMVERERLREEAKGGVAPVRQTLKEYVLSWLDVTAPRCRLLTRNNYAYAVGVILRKEGWKSFEEGQYIDTLTSMQIEKWLGELRKTKVLGRRRKKNGVLQPAPLTDRTLSIESINTIYRVFRMIMLRAASTRVIPSNPCAAVPSLRKQQEESGEGDENSLLPDGAEESDSTDLVDHFLAIAEETEPDYFALLKLGVAIGARVSELRPIRCGVDYNPTTRILVLRRSQRGKSLGPTKNGRARRVRLIQEVADVIAAHMGRLMAEGVPNPMGLMFPSKRTGRFLDASTINHVVERLRKRAGIAGRLTPKFLRRTHVTFNRLRGTDPLLAREVVGHDRDAMQGRYARFPVSATEIPQRAVLGNVIPMPRGGQETANDGHGRGAGGNAGDGGRLPEEAKK